MGELRIDSYSATESSIISTQSGLAHSHRNAGCAASSASCSMRSLTSRMSAWFLAPFAAWESFAGTSVLPRLWSIRSAEKAPLTNSPKTACVEKGWTRKKNDRDGWFTVAQIGSVSRSPARSSRATTARRSLRGECWPLSRAVGTAQFYAARARRPTPTHNGLGDWPRKILDAARSRRGCGRPRARPLRCRASRRSRPKISRPSRRGRP